MDYFGYLMTDGRTYDGYLAPHVLIHPEIRFKYRPTHVIDRALFHENTKRVGEKAMTAFMAQALAARIHEWSMIERLEDGTTQPFAITVDNMYRLEPLLFRKFVEIVIWGDSRGEVDPKTADDEARKAAEDEMASAISGTPIMDALLEGEEKNLPTV